MRAGELEMIGVDDGLGGGPGCFLRHVVADIEHPVLERSAPALARGLSAVKARAPAREPDCSAGLEST